CETCQHTVEQFSFVGVGEMRDHATAVSLRNSVPGRIKPFAFKRSYGDWLPPSGSWSMSPPDLLSACSGAPRPPCKEFSVGLASDRTARGAFPAANDFFFIFPVSSGARKLVDCAT